MDEKAFKGICCLRGVGLQFVEESGHEPQEEKPEITAEIIRKFLQGKL